MSRWWFRRRKPRPGPGSGWSSRPSPTIALRDEGALHSPSSSPTSGTSGILRGYYDQKRCPRRGRELDEALGVSAIFAVAHQGGARREPSLDTASPCVRIAALKPFGAAQWW